MMQSTTTTRSLKEKQRQEREALILQAAEEVLAEKGYHETSMDEIAARVGIAKGTVYLHFPSKEDLVVALFEGNIQKMAQEVEVILSSELTALYTEAFSAGRASGSIPSIIRQNCSAFLPIKRPISRGCGSNYQHESPHCLMKARPLVSSTRPYRHQLC